MDGWRVVKTPEQNILLTYSFTPESYLINWTELDTGFVPYFGKGWGQQCLKEDFEVFARLYNPTIDFDSENISRVLIDKLYAIISNIDSDGNRISVTGGSSDECRTLVLASRYAGASNIYFNWRFECCLLTAVEYCKAFVTPIFKLSAVLNQQVIYLENLLMRKDNEIAEHKSNGSVLKRAHLETEPYQKDMLNKLADPLKDISSLFTTDRVSKTISVISRSESVECCKDLQSKKEIVKETELVAKNQPKTPDLEQLDIEKKRRAEIETKNLEISPKKRKPKSIF